MLYSVIIPYKNAPILLQRCIASIPQRDDLQIIVVDDNSDNSIVDWETITLDMALKMYLYCNSVWLLVIRMAYTDRMAYFSWFLIPFICLYPVITYQKAFKHPQRVVLLFMAVFMSVRLLLSLRSVL